MIGRGSPLRGLAGISLAICVTAMATAGCGSAKPVAPVVSGTQDTIATPPPTAGTLPSAQPSFDDQLLASGVCLGEPLPDAAPFAGPGPHPILFTDTAAKTYPDDGPVELNPASWSPTDGNPVQLVACAAVVPGPAARTCYYQGIGHTVTLTIDWGDYTITLYAAKTATEVAVTHLRGTSTDCPFSVTVKPGSTTAPVQVSQFTVGQIQHAFGRYIDGAA